MESTKNEQNDVDMFPDDNKNLRSALIKKRFDLDDNSQFMITCKVNWSEHEKLFKFQLIPIDEETGKETDKVESELQLYYKDVKKIIKYVEYKDIMPITFHMKQIKIFFSLTKWLIMPFVNIRLDDEGKKEIAIYPKPQNLLTNSLSDMPTVKFLGEQCVMIFTHVSRQTFRIILTNPGNVEEVVRIDVDFDQTSFDKCFRKSGGKPAALRSVDVSNKIVTRFEDYANDEALSEFKHIEAKLRDHERVDEEELESFKVIHENLAEELGENLKVLESFLASYGLERISQIVDEKELKYLKLKIHDEMKKTTLHFIWDRPDKQVLEVKLQNFYETYAPESKVKALGYKDYSYESVWKNFGLTYTSLDDSEKLGVCSMISEIFNLYVFEKKISKEDFDAYEENAIAFVPIEIGCFQRIFLGEKHEFPLTLSLVGIRGEPKGVRATIYNLDDASELGVFFHINPALWAVPENEKKKKKLKTATVTLVEHYHLDYILRKCGWEILKDSLVLDKRPNRIDIVGIKMFKEIRNVEQIENVLNPDTILKYFDLKERDD